MQMCSSQPAVLCLKVKTRNRTFLEIVLGPLKQLIENKQKKRKSIMMALLFPSDVETGFRPKIHVHEIRSLNENRT